MSPPRRGSLQGIRVLDLSRVLAGPFCAMILADLGAEVIKVESPEGDDSRHFGPTVKGESGYYRLFNRSKFGITLNLKDTRDRSKLLDLVRNSDVIIENFRPGVMDRLGIAAGTLLEINPRLVVVSISGFGQDGPLRNAPAYDLIAQAMSGLMSVTGWPGGQPTRVGVSLGDIIPGLYGATAALAALQERHLTGKGQHIDIAMLDSLVSILESVGMRALHGEEPAACGNDHAMSTPFSTYQTKDGTVAIAIAGDRLFPRLTEALGRSEWLADERFKEQTRRNTHPAEFRAALETALSTLTTAEVVTLLQAHQVPVSEVYSVKDALTNEHARTRGLVAIESDGFATLASPIRLTGSVQPRPAPKLGEHNDRISEWIISPECAEEPDQSLFDRHAGAMTGN
ncbi:CaiB/BaiF CoA transferase family protein [Pseudarthrobacter sp. H2]|uniref:CaiB/BaiF CoA transferase family protein n=1 Tax=Pseudarthrobacter sp. H2 TaxID=3418415 RepID=UPI003CE96F41